MTSLWILQKKNRSIAGTIYFKTLSKYVVFMKKTEIMRKQRIVSLMLSFLGSCLPFNFVLFKFLFLVFTVCIEVIQVCCGDRKSTRQLR